MKTFGLTVRDGHTGTRCRRERRAEVKRDGIAVQVPGWDCDEQHLVNSFLVYS